MDPDENLKRVRELILAMRHQDRGYDDHDIAQLGEELADFVEVLDKWICRGGFLPKEWKERK